VPKYTLTAAGAGFTRVSASLTITIGPAARLAVSTQPSGSTGAVLSCAAPAVAAVNGIATFTGCSIDKTGTYTLTATSAGLIFTVSGSVAIAAGAPAKLEFTTQPSPTTAGTAFSTQPVVSIQDAGGNTATSTLHHAMTREMSARRLILSSWSKYVRSTRATGSPRTP
jgi:hypothetical protein